VSSMLVCDVCGKPLVRPHYRLRVLRAEPDQQVNVMKTVGNLDMHDECLKIFKAWMTDYRIKEQSQ
jgi:hypothetical protein